MRYCKIKNLPIIIYSFLLSTMFIISRHFIIKKSNCFSVYMEDITVLYFNFTDIISIIFGTIGMTCVFFCLSDSLSNADVMLWDNGTLRKRGKCVFLFSFIILIICWLPYLLSYMPGGVFVDAYSIIDQATGDAHLNNHHPVLYTFIWRLFFRLFGSLSDPQFFVEAFTIFQSLVFAITITFFIYWLYKNGFSLLVILATLSFYALSSLIPIYAISLWKDTLFCLAFYSYTLWKYNFVKHAGIIYGKNRR